MLDLLAYFDASGNHEQQDNRGRFSPAVVVAGFIATKKQWESFHLTWEKLLSEYDVPYLHSNEINTRTVSKKNPYHSWSESKVRRFRSDCVEALKKHKVYGIGQAVLLDDFNSLKKDMPNSHLFFQSPYYFCSLLCFLQSAEWAKRQNYDSSIEYVFESGDKYKGEVLDAHTEACKDWETRKYYHFVKNGLTFRSGKLTPLQGADGLAYGMYKELFRMKYQPELEYTREEFVPYITNIEGSYQYFNEHTLLKFAMDVFLNKDLKKYYEKEN